MLWDALSGSWPDDNELDVVMDDGKRRHSLGHLYNTKSELDVGN